MAIQFTTDQIKDDAITAAKIDTSGTFTFTSGIVEVAGITSGSGDNYAAPKAYVDSVANGLYWKDSVEYATIVSINGAGSTIADGSGYAWILSEAATGAETIDGQVPSVGHRVLIKSQSSALAASVSYIISAVPVAGKCINFSLNDGSASQTYTTNFVASGGTTDAWTGGSSPYVADIDISVTNTAAALRTALAALWNNIPLYTGGVVGDDAKVQADTAEDATFNVTTTQDAASGGSFVSSNGSTERRQYNGIYTVTTVGAVGVTQVFTRAKDMNDPAEFRSAAVFVVRGSTLLDTGWVCTNDTEPTLGTTAIDFTQFTGAGQLTAGNGIEITGNSIAVRTDGSSLLAGVGGLKINTSGVDTNELAANAVSLVKAGWQWQSKVLLVPNATTNSITVTSATLNANFQGPKAIFVFRNGQTMLPDDSTTAGTGVLSGKYGTDITDNVITVVFDGYLGDGDQMEIRYLA